MDAALLFSRLLLAAVLGIAALAKLADRAGSEKSLIGFGLPKVLAAPLGIILPMLELVTSVLLVPVASAWWGAVSALALLLTFAAAIGVNVTRGRRPDCHCFGQLHSEPASWRTVARNVALAAVAGFLVWRGNPHPGPSAMAWFDNLSIMQVVLVIAGLTIAAVLAAQGWLLVQLLRQHGRLLLRIDALESTRAGGLAMSPGLNSPAAHAGLPIGLLAPAFQLPDVNGQVRSLDEILELASTPVLLVFVDPGCEPCIALAPDLALIQQGYASILSIVLISRAAPNENRTKLAAFGNILVLLEAERQVADAYQAHGTPAAVVVGQDGRVASPLATGADQIRSLIRTALPPFLSQRSSYGEASLAETLTLVATPKLGEALPAIELPDLAGKTISLEEFRGHWTALLFWHPQCTHCARLLPELRRWEMNRSDGAPKLLIVSGGTVQANRAMGLQSSVMLDQAFGVGRAELGGRRRRCCWTRTGGFPRRSRLVPLKFSRCSQARTSISRRYMLHPVRT